MRPVFAGLLLALLLSLQAAPAAAHPEVLRSDPPAGGIVDAAPPLLTITFTEPVESRLLDISVVSEAGTRVDRGDAQRLDNARQVQVGLGSVGQGGYLVRWRALGFDGHIVSGVFNFGVGRAPTMQATNPAHTPVSEALTRWVTLVASCLLVGGVLFRQLVLVPAARSDAAFAALMPRIEERLLSLIWAGFSIFLGASVVLLATQTLAAGRVAGLSRLGEVLLGSRFGQLWIARMALLSALGAALAHFEAPGSDAAPASPRAGRRKASRRAQRASGSGTGLRAMALAPLGVRLPLISALIADPVRPPARTESGGGGGSGGDPLGVMAEIDRSRERWWWIAAALGVVLLFLFSLGGHPAVTDAALVAIPIDWIHRTAAVVWIGGTFYLAVLWLAHYVPHDVFMSLLRRFTAVALASAAIVIPTGLFAAWVYIPSPAETTDSPYGAVLLIKLALVAGMGALGILHWRAAQQPDRNSPRLARTLVTEALLGAAVLAAVALLVNLAPAKGQSQARQAATAADARQSSSAEVLTLAANAGPNLVTLTVDPPRPGSTRLRMDVIDDVGRPVDDATVTVRAIPTAGQASESNLSAATQGGGRYVADWSAGPGRWNLEVSVARPGQSEAVASFSADLPVPGARDILRRSDQAMNRLQGVKEEQVIDGGAGNALAVTYTYIAPDRMRATDNGGIEIVAALGQRYERRGDQWQVEPWPDPRGFSWPTYTYANLTPEIRLLRIEELEGRPHFVVAFVDGQGVRYTFWIDTETYLISRQRMLTPGHYMTSTFTDFNGALTVEPPDLPDTP